VLAAAEGQSDSAIAQQLDVNRKTVTLWRARFIQEGVDSLWEVAQGRGRKPIYGPEKIQSIVDATLRTKPKGMTQWSCRLMAARQGVSKSTINNIWQSHNLKPHRVKTFKLSRDAKFLEKLTDVVGLYLNPPQQAIVLCVDEKSQIQALDRTQPGLPLKKGRCGTMTHDYKRNGTTSLFAALDVLQGRVIGQCYERHRHQEFLQFLRRLDQEFPGEIRLHLVMDNYGTHKQPKVQAWLKRHPRFVSHFVPTSSSWLNLVERWFGELTSKRIRRGSASAAWKISRRRSPSSWPLGMRIRNPLSGPPPWNRSWKSYRAVDKLWNRFGPAVPYLDGEKRNVELASYLSDAILGLRIARV